MPVTIIVIGKRHEEWIKLGIERYQKRLRAPFLTNWIFLPHSSFEGDKARQEESERIQQKLSGYDYVVLLDERGRLVDSPTLSSLLSTQFSQSRRVALVIGGAYGVTDELRRQAHIVWSLSPLVFPHQLVRLIVTEQLYRAQAIVAGSHYHHK